MLQLRPHPEGGHYREIWVDTPSDGSRGIGSAIFYLLQAGERSHWHRFDAIEAWHFYAGDPLRLKISLEGKSTHEVILGNNFAEGHQPFVLVSKGHWHTAEPLGRWTLVGCTVWPAFLFSNFELAPQEWMAEQTAITSFEESNLNEHE